jgi:hypothetical protein
MFGGIKRLSVGTNELLTRLRAAAPRDTLEGRAVGEQAPKPVLQTETGLDDKLG